jgi:hypothetical protein
VEGHVRLRFLFCFNMFPSKESVEVEENVGFNVLPKLKKEVENS